MDHPIEIPKLRQLTEKGIDKFVEFLIEEKNGRENKGWKSVAPTPYYLLTDDSFSEEIFYNEIEIPDSMREFLMSNNIGRNRKKDYLLPLKELFKGIPIPKLQAQNGLWTWLSLFYFAGLQPSIDELSNREDANSQRCGVIRIEHYAMRDNIQKTVNSPRYVGVRHRLYQYYMTMMEFADKDKNIAEHVLYQTRAYVTGDLEETILSNGIFNTFEYMKLFDILYRDSSQETGFKRGAGGKTKGSARRLYNTYELQFSLTHDVKQMTADEIIDKLKKIKEFDRFTKNITDINHPTNDSKYPIHIKHDEFREKIADEISGESEVPFYFPNGPGRIIASSETNDINLVIRPSGKYKRQNYDFWYTHREDALKDISDESENYYIFALNDDSLRYYSFSEDEMDKLLNFIEPSKRQKGGGSWDLYITDDIKNDDVFISSNNDMSKNMSIKKYEGFNYKIKKPQYSYGIKILTKTDVQSNDSKSNEHAVYGGTSSGSSTSSFTNILGTDIIKYIPIVVRYWTDQDPKYPIHLNHYKCRLVANIFTWSKADKKKEWRLYYTNPLEASPGDMFIIRKDNIQNMPLAIHIIQNNGNLKESILEKLKIDNIENKLIVHHSGEKLFNDKNHSI